MPVFDRNSFRFDTCILIKLDGVEQHDVVAVDTDRGLVTRYARDVQGNLLIKKCGCCYVIETVSGSVEMTVVVPTHILQQHRII